ncbi:DUF1488 family protein [Arsukibacterium indicum]|uniref:DUF1488 domain-containing protein n=1 Tax=Arsukibacterium indicum TaxID=2848612 RepID=A0ABS6MN22_9GAMM|nr:DUF1488 family protein [Arsukibacterium indicum]MBV2130221.1 DUF1488 domain-containing protein [Arsukibacterium indicum]
MNQQLIFNNDFQYDAVRQAVRFSCLLAGLKVHCFVALPASTTASEFLASVKAEAFNWEDSAEQAIADDAFNPAGEIWL